MSSILNKLLSILTNTAVKRGIVKPLNRAMEQSREDANLRMGYDKVSKRIDRRSTYAKSFFVHLIIVIAAAPVLRIFVRGNPYSSASIDTLLFIMAWALCLLLPHGYAVLLYYMRWSPKELEPFERAKRKEAERKRNSRSDYNFSEDWDR